jgi:reactive intermediate/imine deaminase
MRMKKIINTSLAPAAIGAYNQAIQVGSMVFLSGQIPLDPATGTLKSEVFEEQVHQVFKNLRSVCQAAGGDLQHIVKMNVFLIDMQYFSIFNQIMMDYFEGLDYPARSAIACLGLPRQAKIEIEAIMHLDV